MHSSANRRPTSLTRSDSSTSSSDSSRSPSPVRSSTATNRNNKTKIGEHGSDADLVKTSTQQQQSKKKLSMRSAVRPPVSPKNIKSNNKKEAARTTRNHSKFELKAAAAALSDEMDEEYARIIAAAARANSHVTTTMMLLMDYFDFGDRGEDVNHRDGGFDSAPWKKYGKSRSSSTLLSHVVQEQRVRCVVLQHNDDDDDEEDEEGDNNDEGRNLNEESLDAIAFENNSERGSNTSASRKGKTIKTKTKRQITKLLSVAQGDGFTIEMIEAVDRSLLSSSPKLGNPGSIPTMTDTTSSSSMTDSDFNNKTVSTLTLLCSGEQVEVVKLNPEMQKRTYVVLEEPSMKPLTMPSLSVVTLGDETEDEDDFHGYEDFRGRGKAEATNKDENFQPREHEQEKKEKQEKFHLAISLSEEEEEDDEEEEQEKQKGEKLDNEKDVHKNPTGKTTNLRSDLVEHHKKGSLIQCDNNETAISSLRGRQSTTSAQKLSAPPLVILEPAKKNRQMPPVPSSARKQNIHTAMIDGDGNSQTTNSTNHSGGNSASTSSTISPIFRLLRMAGRNQQNCDCNADGAGGDVDSCRVVKPPNSGQDNDSEAKYVLVLGERNKRRQSKKNGTSCSEDPSSSAGGSTKNSEPGNHSNTTRVLVFHPKPGRQLMEPFMSSEMEGGQFKLVPSSHRGHNDEQHTQREEGHQHNTGSVHSYEVLQDIRRSKTKAKELKNCLVVLEPRAKGKASATNDDDATLDTSTACATTKSHQKSQGSSKAKNFIVLEPRKKNKTAVDDRSLESQSTTSSGVLDDSGNITVLDPSSPASYLPPSWFPSFGVGHEQRAMVEPVGKLSHVLSVVEEDEEEEEQEFENKYDHRHESEDDQVVSGWTEEEEKERDRKRANEQQQMLVYKQHQLRKREPLNEEWRFEKVYRPIIEKLSSEDIHDNLGAVITMEDLDLDKEGFESMGEISLGEFLLSAIRNFYCAEEMDEEDFAPDDLSQITPMVNYNYDGYDAGLSKWMLCSDSKNGGEFKDHWSPTSKYRKKDNKKTTKSNKATATATTGDTKININDKSNTTKKYTRYSSSAKGLLEFHRTRKSVLESTDEDGAGFNCKPWHFDGTLFRPRSTRASPHGTARSGPSRNQSGL
ncbi:hypothetical protein ACA910_012557 [Epithemia clementina (nom. ined.)]